MSTNVRWEPGHVDREDRKRTVGCGGTVWMTGLPASGKSTIAKMIEERLLAADRRAYRSTATTSGTVSTRTSASTTTRAPRTCGERRTWHDCSPTPGCSPSSA